MDTFKKVAIIVIILGIIGVIIYGASVFIPTMYKSQTAQAVVVEKPTIKKSSTPKKINIAVEEAISENSAIDEPIIEESVTFVPREQKAADSLPYYLKNFTFTWKSEKEVAHAIPDIEPFKELTSDKIDGQSIYDLCVSLFPNSYDKILQLCTVFIRKDTSSNDYVRNVLLAYTISDKVQGISHIEYLDGIMTCYDIDKKKLTVDTATGVVKNGNKEIVINANDIIDISKKLESEFGFVLPEEQDRRSEVAEKEAAQAKEDAEKLQKEQGKVLLEQQKALTQTIKNTEHPFTDKNGTSTTFTNEEWTKLKSVWDYTGDGESYIGHHTVAELRQLLANLK